MDINGEQTFICLSKLLAIRHAIDNRNEHLYYSHLRTTHLFIMITSVRLFILYLFVAFYYPTTAFSTVQFSSRTKISIIDRRCNAIIPHNLSANSNDGNTKKKGDSLRDATGIRPSLHPTTINCIAEALLLRSQCILGELIL